MISTRPNIARVVQWDRHQVQDAGGVRAGRLRLDPTWAWLLARDERRRTARNAGTRLDARGREEARLSSGRDNMRQAKPQEAERAQGGMGGGAYGSFQRSTSGLGDSSTPAFSYAQGVEI